MVPAVGAGKSMNRAEWIGLLVMIAIFVLAVVLTVHHHGDPPGYWGY
jgi:hypothetical protein